MNQKPRNKSSYLWIIVGIALILVVVILGYFLNKPNEENQTKQTEIKKDYENELKQRRIDSLEKENKKRENELQIIKRKEKEKKEQEETIEKRINDEINRENIKVKQEYDKLDPLEKNIIENSKIFRKLQVKEKQMLYIIKYKTSSSELDIKNKEFEDFVYNEYSPIIDKFSNLLSQYNDKKGGDALRNFAIKWGFLDLLK